METIVVQAQLANGNNFAFVLFDVQVEFFIVMAVNEELSAACWMTTDSVVKTF